MKKNQPYILFFILFLQFSAFSQTLTNSEIKEYIDASSKEMGLPIEIPGSGVVMESMTVIGRTILYSYEVPEGWFPVENLKQELINALNSKLKKLYVDEEISLLYNYFRNKNLVAKAYIAHGELGTKTELTSLGDYISYKSHPKAKGINIKIKDPIAFEKLEGNRPNIVAKFNNKANNLVYLLQINEAPYFTSRTSFENEFSSLDDVENFAKNHTSSMDVKYVSSKLTKIDRYPAIEIVYDRLFEVGNQSLSTRSVMWFIAYEDKIIYLMGSSDLSDFEKNYYLFLKITNSIVFEDQYNNRSNNYVGDFQNFDLYVDQFFREIEQSGILKVRPKQVNIQLKSLDTSKDTYHMHGFSTGYDDDDVINITINKRSWNTFNKAQKYYLIFHELSHDVLNLDDLEFNEPNEKNIMYPSISAYKDLTMDDFINNFNSLLENYINTYPNPYEEYLSTLDNTVIFKDGYSYDGSSYVDNCANSTRAEREVSLNFCNCMLRNLSEKLTFNEFLELNISIANQVDSSNSASTTDHLLKSNKLINDIATDCSKLLENSNSMINISEQNIIVLAENHLNEIKEEIGFDEYIKLAKLFNLKDYSECFVRKLYANFNASELINISESDSEVIEAIQESCFIENRRPN